METMMMWPTIGWSSAIALATGINIAIWGRNVPVLPALLIPLGAGGLGAMLGVAIARLGHG